MSGAAVLNASTGLCLGCKAYLLIRWLSPDSARCAPGVRRPESLSAP